jgi:hypothetical protein
MNALLPVTSSAEMVVDIPRRPGSSAAIPKTI